MRPQFYLLRKTVLALSFVLGLSCIAAAQEQQTSMENSRSPKFGVKGGINLSNLYVDAADDENMKVGLNLGFFAKIPITRGLSVQPELLYSSKGSKLTYDNVLLGKGEYRFNLNYVEVPLLLVINVAKNLNIKGGGYLSYLASANIKDMDENGTVDDIKDLNVADFNRFDYGLVGGLGVDVMNFTIGARYSYGLKEVGKARIGNLVNDSKNSVISLYVGIGF